LFASFCSQKEDFRFEETNQKNFCTLGADYA